MMLTARDKKRQPCFKQSRIHSPDGVVRLRFLFSVVLWLLFDGYRLFPELRVQCRQNLRLEFPRTELRLAYNHDATQRVFSDAQLLECAEISAPLYAFLLKGVHATHDTLCAQLVIPW